MDILDVLRNRRSDRHFDGRPLEQPQIDLLIEAFRWAPSSNNRQPWRLIFATSPEARAGFDDALSAGNRQWAPAAPVKIVVIGTAADQPDRNGQSAWMLDGVPIAARAPADGYTLLLVSSAQAISPSIYPKLSYDLVRDFAPVTQFTAGLYLLMVHPSVPARSVKELIALARSRRGQLTYGSAGTGTGTHLTGELFKASAKVDVLHVPYRGMGPAIGELLGGQISLIFGGLASGLPHMKAGRARALGVTSARRSDAAPELPTLAEAGLPGFESTTWQGLAVPAATPRDIINRLHAESVKIMQFDEIRTRLGAMGAHPVGSSPEQFAAYIKSEIAKWGRLIRDIGLRLE